MKKSKLFMSLSAFALAGMMTFSSVSLVSAEKTQNTMKVEINGSVSEKTLHTIKVVDVVHYSDGDLSQTRYINGSIEKEMFASEGSHYSFSPKEFKDDSIIPVTGNINGIVGKEDITITFEYTSPNVRPGNASDFNGFSEYDYLLVNFYAKDTEGTPIDGIKIQADNCSPTGDLDYWGSWYESYSAGAFPECKTTNGAIGFIVNHFIYSALSFDVKYIIDDAGAPIDGVLNGNKCLKLKNASNADCTYTILDTENNKIADVVFSSDDTWRTETSLMYEVKNLDSDWEIKVDAKSANEYDEIKSGNDIIDNLDDAVYANTDSAIIANITATLKSEKNIVNKKPQTVKNLKQKSTYTNKIEMNWSKVSGITGYEIWRANTKNAKYSKVLDVKTNTGKYYVTGGSAYWFKVRAYKELKDGSRIYGDYSVATKLYSKPSTPTFTLTKAGGTKIKVSWDKSVGANIYEIYMSTSKTGTYKLVTTRKSTHPRNYTISKLTKGKAYYFKIRTYKVDGNGGKIYSNWSTIKYFKLNK